MADNEQELLSDEEIVYLNVGRKPIEEELKQGVKKVYPNTVRIAKAQIAKLKAIGYEQVWIDCPDCNGFKKRYVGKMDKLDSGWRDCSTCKGTGRKRKLVKWDREKVAELIDKLTVMDGERVSAIWGIVSGRSDAQRMVETQLQYTKNQLKEILTERE